MEKLPVENTAQKVGLKNKLAFASGDIFGGGSFNIINFLFVPFLTLTVGIPMYWVSVIMLISKVWDGIIDPFIGKISDRKTAGQIRQTPFLHARVRAHTHCGDHSFVFPLESWSRQAFRLKSCWSYSCI